MKLPIPLSFISVYVISNLHAAHPSPVTITDSGLNSRTVGLGASTRLSCSSPATSPHYQWSHNGSNISSAISSWYTVSSANFSDAGKYTCVVSNLVGTGYGSYQLQVQGMEHAVSWSCIEHVWTPAVQLAMPYFYLHACSLQHPLQMCASLTQDLPQTQCNWEPLPCWDVLPLALPPLCTSGGTMVPSYQLQHLPPTESLLFSSVMQGGTPVQWQTWLEMTGVHTHWMFKVKMVYMYL